MNGFSEHSSLSEDNFGESKSVSIRAFDAFPKIKPTYQTPTRTGSAWTLLLIAASVSLIFSESRRWFAGTTSHAFAVEKGVSHDLQINLDVVVAMNCDDLHINIQDASGDRVLAGETLTKDATKWEQWAPKPKRMVSGGWWEDVPDDPGNPNFYGKGEDEDVHEYLSKARRKRKFKKTPRLRGEADACRIFGSVEGNKVQGDFHITARGHGYIEWGPHLGHDRFNFSHIVNTLSFGPYYPGLSNPLTATHTTTDEHFFKYQYYANIVPTIYTEDSHHLNLAPPSKSKKDASEPLQNVDEEDLNHLRSSSTVYTNQYAVTEQSHKVAETAVPGIFVKYSIEPILLLVSEERGGFLALVIRLINVISGVLVAGTWCWQLTDWGIDMFGGQTRERLGFLGLSSPKEAKFV